MRKILLLPLMLILLVSCSSLEVETDSFNEYLKDKDSISTDELFVEEYFKFLEYESIPNVDIIVEENEGKKVITTVNVGFRDDSVYGEKYYFTVNNSNTYWEVLDIKMQVKCQKGRGHRYWNGSNCY